MMSTFFMPNNSKVQTFFILILLVAAGVGGYFASQVFLNGKKTAHYQSLKLYPQGKAFSGFYLIDKNQQKIDENYFNGKWTVLFFGYTNCPDVCPTTLSELQKTYKILLSENKIKQMPEILFVSVDGERDSAQHLKDYIAFFNPKFNAASSNDANILALTRQIGAAYHIDDHQKGENNYNVDHTAALFVIAPSKELYAIFPSPHLATKMAHDLTELIGNK